MRIRPAPDVTPHLRADGRLELHCAGSRRRYRCDEFGAAAWIALRQHDGDPAAAARTLAAAWYDDPAAVRAELDLLIEALHAARLVTVTPPAPGRPRHLRAVH